MSTYDASDIAGFMNRDWDALEANGRDFWQTQHPASKLRAAADLTEHAKRHSDWPTRADREEDWAAHQRLSELLARGSRGA